MVIGILYLSFIYTLVHDDMLAGYNALMDRLPENMREWLEAKRRRLSSTNMQNPLMEGHGRDEREDGAAAEEEEDENGGKAVR